MLIPAPRSGRELLEALRLFDPEPGIGKFLDRLDLAGVSHRQIIFSVFGRLPPAQGARPQPDYNPRNHLRNLLLGEEFQKRLMNLVLECYPEKKRLLFVHVPKCAGSDLTSLLMKHSPAFNFRLVDRTWVTSDRMLAAVKLLVDELSYASRIFVHGHVPLKQYLADGLIRFGDEIFSIVRNPLDMVVSRLNYMLGRFIDDPEHKRVDTRGWLRLVNGDTLTAAIASGDYRQAAHNMLFAPGLIPSNPVCLFLGEGTARTALDLCARADVELSHVDRYNEWLNLRWGVGASKRSNASRPIVTLEALGSEARQRAEALTEEDRVFVGHVERKMQEENKCFVMGTQLEA